MAWRDELRPASFRGVAFKVDAHSLGLGRRKARHEYPQRDLPYMEDMGRKAREYKVEAYVIGSDYMSVRDALIKALETGGAGQLVHPYFGTLQVEVLDDCQISESTREGGMARIAISFIEAGKQQEPSARTNTDGVFKNQQLATEDAVARDFSKGFGVAGKPGFVGDAALKQINSILALPSMYYGSTAQLRADPLNAISALLPENLQASMRDPLVLARGVLAVVRQATDVAELLGYGEPVTGDAIATPSRQALNNNTAALNGLVVQAATINRVGVLATSEPATQDDARVSRSEILALTDAVLLDESAGQETADAVLQLRTDAVAHFASLQPSLPRLVTITPRVVQPASVLAYEQYGDAWYEDGRDDEIITRNNIRHPGFVPAGRALQLVTP